MLNEDGVRKDNNHGGLSPSSIRQHHFLLSAIYETAVTWEIVESNPCSKIKLSKLGYSDRDSRIRIEESMYTLEQAKELIKYLKTADLKYQLLVYLAIFTGCRREELLGLEWRDVNFETGEIFIERSSQYTPKDGIYEDDLKTSKSRRSCFIPEKLLSLLKKYQLSIEDMKTNYIGTWINSNKLFIQKNGREMHPDTPTKWFNKFFKEK
jgi:integrase